MVFFHVVESGVCSHWNAKDVSLCEIFLREREKLHYTLWNDRIVYISLFFGRFIM